ncbi:MAG: sulfatase-like hydrolase/transferase [Bdellovibrionaceae bacterium]|nr:sulfatase-like hydrolase/transferase [Pseudobdellovibrionaceae bacterium]
MKTFIKNFFSQGPLLVSGKIFLFTLVLSWLYRIVFFSVFADATIFHSISDLLYSLYLSLKLDIRLSILVIAPFFLLWPLFKKIKKKIYTIFWLGAYFIFYFFLLLVFIFDSINFDYLGSRLSFSSMRFFNDFKTSLQVGLDYYPVFSILIALIAVSVCVFFVLKRIFFPIKNSGIIKLNKLQYFCLYFIVSFMMALGIYGKIAPPPALRWSDVYFLKNNFLIKATLNPLLYFYDSSQWNSVAYDINAVKKIYPYLKKTLGIYKKTKSISFDRVIKATAQGKLDKNTNVVVIIMESLAKHKTSLMNPMNSTPYLKAIAKNGVYFNNFFTSTMGTARGVFSTVSSVPDPNFGRKGTASRNNNLPAQNSAFNALSDHKKFYFLGGSLNWAQMRGVLHKAIPDMTLFEEGSYKRPNTDVWGLSDLDLVIEANEVFKKQKKPFAAIIQFASFHSPFSIPKDKKSFQLVKKPLKVLKKNGFRHLAEYNSLRFSDYSLHYLMELAKKNKYFDNTVFVILGDHGLSIRGDMAYVPRYIKDFQLGYAMTPLIFYAPKKLKPKIYTKFALQVDVLPSVVAALGKSFVATGFGINLFNKSLSRKYIITQPGAGPEINLFYKDKILQYNIAAKKTAKTAFLNPYRLTAVSDFPYTDDLQERIKSLHEAMKYILLHNKKNNEKLRSL